MRKLPPSPIASEEGQAILEYILLISIVGLLFVGLMNGLGKIDVIKRLMKPLNGDYAHAYQYGHPKALGFDDGGPQKHPRAIGGDSFRIFYARP
ncbi:MAG: hypothetical protein ACJ763_02325 [Bdellovibrionia bacterium]